MSSILYRPTNKGLSLDSNFSKKGILRKEVSSFNPLTSLPWDSVWQAGTNTFAVGTTPATNGQSVEGWKDVSNTIGFFQFSSTKQPTYFSSDALLNGKAYLEGNRGAGASMQWNRTGTIAAPYTVIVIGIMPAKLADYQCFVGNAGGILNMWPWDNYNAGNSAESIYLNGVNREGNARNTKANLWHFNLKASNSDHRIGRNGISSVPASFAADVFGGFSLWRYPTSDILNGGGKIAFVGVAATSLLSHANWPAFLTWVQSYYGIAITTRKALLCDGDSRTRGYQYLDDANHMDKMWMHLLESRFTDETGVMNIGVAGRTQATQNSDAATRLTPAVNELVCTKKVVVMLSPCTNDIGGGATGAVAYQLICDYVRARHLQGLQVLLTTLPRWSGSPEAARLALNVLILANAGDGAGGGNSIADGVADVANDADTSAANPFAFLNSTTPHNPGNFNADAVHWSTAGNVIIADKLETAIGLSPFSIT